MMPEGMNCLKNIDNKMEAYKILDRKRMISWSPNWSQKIKDPDHLEKTNPDDYRNSTPIMQVIPAHCLYGAVVDKMSKKSNFESC